MNNQINTVNKSDLKTINGVPMMGSRNIAEITGKKPAHIVRDIESMLEALGKHYPDMDDHDSKEFSIKRKMYNGRLVIDEIWLDESLSMTLVTGYDACRRLALIEQWKEMKHELSQPRIEAHPERQETIMNNDILSLARVVAEATASATMKAVMEVSGMNVVAQKPVTATSPAAIENTQPDNEHEYSPVHKVSWATGLSDATCRRLVTFSAIPSRHVEGVRGMCVHQETFLEAAQALITESTPPAGKRKRWQHPEFGGFELRLKSDNQQEAK